MSSHYEKIQSILNDHLDETKFVYLSLRNRKKTYAHATLLERGYKPQDGSVIAGILEGVRFVSFDDRAPDEQARLYDSYGDMMARNLQTMNNQLKKFRQGKVVRFVLDLESGALYYRQMLGHFWIYGVTVNQYFASGEGGVDVGDVTLGHVVEDIEKVLRGS